MSEQPNKFYVTTPIYYVNARPHIGHAYTTIVADVLARRHRLLGDDTFFLTGTDEHGQKIERSAAVAGIPPQQFADQVSEQFESLWKRMGITNDKFIRTTDPKHKAGVQKLFTELYNRGHIYLDSYTGAYCVSDEAFVDVQPGEPCPDCGRITEIVTEENFFFRLSAFQRPLLDLIESNTLKIENEARRNEVLSFLRGNVDEEIKDVHFDLIWESDKTPTGADRSKALQRALESGRIAESSLGFHYVPGALKDLSVSRSSFTWGIPVPEEVQRRAGATKQHVVYVWLDALANYITAVGYGSDAPQDIADFAKWWPADLHLVGKEIIRFHCIYWPAFLLGLNPELQTNSVILSGAPEHVEGAESKDPDSASTTESVDTFPRQAQATEPPQLSPEQHAAWAAKMLPKAITAHGWLLFDNSKMSKSKGNIVRTETILDAFGQLCPPNPAPQESQKEAALVTEGTQSAPPLLSSFREAGGSALPVHVNNAASVESAPRHASLKGTASAVPQQSHQEAALAAEGSLSTPPSLSSRSETEGSASRLLATEPTAHERDLFASDVLRYFLLREIPFGQDGSFSFEAMVTRYNADLANGYGNLVSRTLKLVEQNFSNGLQVPTEPWLCQDRSVWLGENEPKTREERESGTSFLISKLEAAAHFANESTWPELKFQFLLAELMERVGLVDSYLSFHKPWLLAKSSLPIDQRKLTEVLYSASEAIRLLTIRLYPILPFATARVWSQLGLGNIEEAARNGELKNLQWGGLKPGTKLGPLGPIFPRADKGLAQIMIDMENDRNTPASDSTSSSAPARNASLDEPSGTLPRAGKTDSGSRPSLKEALTPATPKPIPASPTDPAAPPRTSSLDEPSGTLPVAGSEAKTTHIGPTPSHAEAQPSGIFGGEAAKMPITANPTDAAAQITIDDFAKVELRVAQIIVCERIPKADKLLRLEVDLGYEKRQILSGIAEWYTPEDLIGRRIVVITNLAPRKMRGLESHGMLLAASEEGGKPVLATFSEDIALGARLK